MGQTGLICDNYNSSKGKEESALLRKAYHIQLVGSPLSSVKNHCFPRLKWKSLQRMNSSYNIRGVLRSPLACCCQSLPFFQ